MTRDIIRGAVPASREIVSYSSGWSGIGPATVAAGMTDER